MAFYYLYAVLQRTELPFRVVPSMNQSEKTLVSSIILVEII